MSLDLPGLLAEAFGDPRVEAAFQRLMEPVVTAALAASAADSWLDSAQAARYVYGSDGKGECFYKLTKRHPLLDRLGVGEGRLKRWKRADLDQWIASNSRAQKRRG